MRVARGQHAPSVICQTLPSRSATPKGLRSLGEYFPTGSGPGILGPDCCFGQCVPSQAGGLAPNRPTVAPLGPQGVARV